MWILITDKLTNRPVRLCTSHSYAMAADFLQNASVLMRNMRLPITDTQQDKKKLTLGQADRECQVFARLQPLFPTTTLRCHRVRQQKEPQYDLNKPHEITLIHEELLNDAQRLLQRYLRLLKYLCRGASKHGQKFNSLFFACALTGKSYSRWRP